MIYFENARGVNIEHLSQVVDEDGKRIYSERLLQGLKSGNLNCLNEIDLADRNNKYYMEPLLFAVKNNESNPYTYEVFQFYGVGLQKQELTTMAAEVAENEPKVFKDTKIAEDPESMIYLAQVNPEIILYISEDLINDGEFIEALCKTGNREAIAYAVEKCNIAEVLQDNPDLASNPTFMKEAIKENYEVVGYIINNKENFGLEAIRCAKETTKELIMEDSIKILTEEAQISDDKRYQKVIDKVKEKGENNLYAVRWATAMAAQSDKVTPEYFKKVFDDSMLAMIEIQKDLTPDGKEKVSIDNMQKLVTPQILNKLKDKAIEQGLETDQDLENKIQEYTEFFNVYRERLKEEKKRNLEKVNNKSEEKDNFEITPQDVEEKTEGARISEINGATREIREEYISQTKEEKEVTNYDRGTDE